MLGTVFLGRYEAVGSLGQGAMGKVYLARERGRNDRMAVVKVMHDHLLRDPKLQQFFSRELEVMARFRHPYAVRLFDGSVNDPNGPCIVMEYIPGQTLEAILAKERRISLKRAAWLLGPLCHALGAAHKMGIIHRDVKPANLMVVKAGTPEESLRVMDLGLALLNVRPHIPLEKLRGKSDFSIAGTPSYLCPESIRGDEVDGRGDIYSVGVTLFEALTGRLPFVYADTEELLHAHLTEEPPKLSDVQPKLKFPHAVEEVIAACMAKYPYERPQTPEELAKRFGQAIDRDIWNGSKPIIKEVVSAPPPPHQPDNNRLFPSSPTPVGSSTNLKPGCPRASPW